MWKIAFFFMVLHSCGKISAYKLHRERPYEQQVAVNQHTLYTKQYGQALHDLASYQEKLQQQGLYPNPPFILTNNANDYGHQYYQVPANTKESHDDDKAAVVTTEQPTTKEVEKGDYHKKHKFIPSIKLDNEKHVKVSSDDKKPFDHIVIHDSGDSNKNENNSVINNLNVTIHRISDNIESKINAIKVYVEQSIRDINKLGDDVYQQVGDKTTKLFDRINKQLERVENQLHSLQHDTFKREQYDIDERFGDDEVENLPRFLFDDKKVHVPNVVDSEVGKKLKTLEQLDDEMRTDFKNSISEAISRAQERFNQMIENQIARVNNKINKIHETVEAVYSKLHNSLGKFKHQEETTTTTTQKIFTPPTYKTTTTTTAAPKKKYEPVVTKHYHWQPKVVTTTTTTTTTTPAPSSTTPDYFKYTVQSYQYRKDDDNDDNVNVDADTKRMDANVDDLDVIESAKNNNDDDATYRSDSSDIIATTLIPISNQNEDELRSDSKNADDDDLQSQVVENLKDTLKDDDDDDEEKEIMENIQATADAVENPIEDKLKSDNEIENEQRKSIDIEKAMVDELRSELQMKEDKLTKNVDITTTVAPVDEFKADEIAKQEQINENAEKSELKETVDQVEVMRNEGGGGESEAKNHKHEDDDDDEAGEEEENEVPAEFDDENVKSTGNDDDNNDATDDTESDEMRSIDVRGNFDNEEIPSDIPRSIDEDITSPKPTHPSKTSHFDELEVIQLIPIIIEQLRQGHVTKNEKESLEKIFGNSLWSLILAEASRKTDDDEMNPLLKTILNSEEVRLTKRDIASQIGNDIYKNSLRRVYRGKSTHPRKRNSPKPYISLDDDKKLLSPSERLLNMIAAIVHKSNVMEKEKAVAKKRAAKLRQKKKHLKHKMNIDKTKNPLGIVKPRQRYVDRILNINRMKRSIIKFGTDLADMKALLLDQVKHENDDDDDNESGEQQQLANNDDDDYMNDDYYDDDDDYDDSQKNKDGKQLASDNNKDDDDYETNVHYNSWLKRRRNIYDDYENGSVNEFINLARQRDRREKNFVESQEDDEEYDENEDEIYDDDN